MKKALLLFLALTVAAGAITADVSAKTKKEKTPKVKQEKVKKEKQVKIGTKDVLKDDEYKMLKTEFFNADGVGGTYICKVEQEKFCKVKDLDTGMYVLCDRQVSRTQWESAKVFYKYGRCTKLN